MSSLLMRTTIPAARGSARTQLYARREGMAHLLDCPLSARTHDHVHALPDARQSNAERLSMQLQKSYERSRRASGDAKWRHR